MKKTLIAAWVVTFLLVNFVGSIPANAAKKIAPDAGTIENSTYTSHYFNFSVNIPAGWYVVTTAEHEKAFEQGKKAFTIEKTMKSASENTDNTYPLLNISRFKPGVTLDLNPSFMVVANTVESLRKMEMGTPPLYLQGIKKSMTASFLPVTFPRDIYTKTIDGVKFSVLEARIKQGDLFFSQAFYATMMNDHILTFTLTFSGSKDDKELQKILKSVKFRKQE